jgi:hypothetical protein
MTGSRFAIGGVSLGGLLVNQRFGMSARKGKNGFVRERIVSSQRPRRNIQRGNENDFNEAKTGRFQARKSFVLPQNDRRPCEKQASATTSRCYLVAVRKHVTTAAR